MRDAPTLIGRIGSMYVTPLDVSFNLLLLPTVRVSSLCVLLFFQLVPCSKYTGLHLVNW